MSSAWAQAFTMVLEPYNIVVMLAASLFGLFVGAMPGLTATMATAGAKTNTAEVTAADQTDIDSTPNNHNAAEDDQASATVAPPVTIGNFVWNDLNGNGLQDAGEPGINGVAVKLYKCDNTLVASTTTAGGSRSPVPAAI